MAKDRRIDELNLGKDNLRRKYDLYLVGQRRTEPLMIKRLRAISYMDD